MSLKSLLVLALATALPLAAHADTYHMRIFNKGLKALPGAVTPGNSSGTPGSGSGAVTPPAAKKTVHFVESQLDFGSSRVQSVHVVNETSEPFTGYVSLGSPAFPNGYFGYSWGSGTTCVGEGPFTLEPGESCVAVYSLLDGTALGPYTDQVVLSRVDMDDWSETELSAIPVFAQVGPVSSVNWDYSAKATDFRSGYLRNNPVLITVSSIENRGNVPHKVLVATDGGIECRANMYSRPTGVSTLAVAPADRTTEIEIPAVTEFTLTCGVFEWPQGRDTSAGISTTQNLKVTDETGKSMTSKITYDARY